jgi:hypothetical protein
MVSIADPKQAIEQLLRVDEHTAAVLIEMAQHDPDVHGSTAHSAGRAAPSRANSS